MAVRLAVALVVAILWTLLAAGVSAAPGAQPRLPEAQPVFVDPRTTALVIVDLSTRCDDVRQICSELVPVIAADLLPRARASNVFIIYTVSLSARGTPLGEVASGLGWREGETVIFPDGTDKFVGGELMALLQERGINKVIVVGSSANQAVLYTASGAARNHRLPTIIPIDGMNTDNPYEYEYTLHQLNNVSFASLFTFTTLDTLQFGE
jgi:nicotinamidase-related amidase